MIKITKHIQEVTFYTSESRCYLMDQYYCSSTDYYVIFGRHPKWGIYRKRNSKVETCHNIIDLFKQLVLDLK